MTINVAVLTAEALVLGCDSIASTTKYLLDPFQFDVEPDEHGTATVTFNMSDIFPQVTNAWGGVTKMFEISRSPSVAAVTAGLAKLDGQTIASLAAQFLKSRHGVAEDVTVRQVAEDFLAFIRVAYDCYYRDSKLPEALKDGPLFLVGGYAVADYFPSLFRINVQENNVVQAYGPGDCGVAWEGQSDSVERLLRGYDMNIRRTIEKSVKDAMAATREAMAQAMVDILQQTLDRLEAEMPSGLLRELPPAPSTSLPWDRFRVRIPYSNLSLQDAVDLAAFLVNIQSGKSKFAHGLATVGGRTHIGIITRQQGFRMLDEPVLKHTNVGFSDACL
jgi:hypothetical protein